MAYSAPALAEAADAGAADAGATDPAEAAQPELENAEPISFKVALEKAEVGLAEPFALTIEVRHDATETYALPDALELKDFGLRAKQSISSGDGPVTTRHQLTLQAFNVGELEVPAIRLAVQTATGPRQLELPAQKLRVLGVIDPAQGEPQMKEDTRPLPTRHEPVWWPLVALAAIALGAALGVYAHRRSKRPPVAPPPKPRAPPHEEAFERLAQLARENLVLHGEKQAYYFRLTEIVREYLGRRYRFDALELTTDELLEALRGLDTPGLDYDGLARFLRSGDLAKFARFEPSDGECKGAFDDARSFVVRTAPPPAAPAASTGGAA